MKVNTPTVVVATAPSLKKSGSPGATIGRKPATMLTAADANRIRVTHLSNTGRSMSPAEVNSSFSWSISLRNA